MNVLICDDSMTIRKKLSKSIKSIDDNIKIFEASDGQQGIDMFKEKQVDLVFLDIIMPEKNGIEVIKEIKNYDSKAEIVVLSSVGTEKNLKAALKNGAKDFIQKPWTEKNIETILKGV
ncbi:MAG: response regulator transcription factor [Bacillota bacterium]